MKKIIFGFLALILTLSLTPAVGHAQEVTIKPTSKKSMSVDDLNEMQKAIKESNLEIDMDNEKKLRRSYSTRKAKKLA